MKWKGSRVARYTVQIGFLAFLTYVGYMHQRLGGGPNGVPPVDALCPLGGFESMYSYIKSGLWLRRTAPSAMVLLASVALMTVLFGRVFCGWICPLGTVGQLSASLGRKIGIKRIELPSRADRVMRLGKYLVLAVAVLGSWHYGTLFWREYDPWVAWMHLSAGWAEVQESPWSFGVLFIAVIAMSMAIERFWCRYLCPLGGLLSALQKVSLVKVRRHDSSCVHCHRCATSCPMGLDPESKDVETSADCIACGDCVEACPVNDTLAMGTSRKTMTPLLVGILGLALFIGVYGTAKLTGLWATSATVPQNSEGVNPAEYVYGWMNLEQVAKATGLSIERLIEIGDLEADVPRDIALKSMEGVDDHEFTDRLRKRFEEDRSEHSPSPVPQAPSNADEIRGSATLTEIGLMFSVDPAEISRRLTDQGWTGEIPLDQPVKEIAKGRGEEVQVIRDAVKDIINRQNP